MTEKIEVLRHYYMKGRMSRQNFLRECVIAAGRVVHAGRYIYYQLGRAVVIKEVASGRSCMCHAKKGVMFLQ
jgi:hypothetical protein